MVKLAHKRKHKKNSWVLSKTLHDGRVFVYRTYRREAERHIMKHNRRIAKGMETKFAVVSARPGR